MVAIFVLLTFILFIAIDIIVLKAQKKTHPAFEKAADSVIFTKNTLTAPLDILLSKGHTWAQKNDSGLIKIGIDEFITKALGRFSLIKTAETGAQVKKGDVIFEGLLGTKKISFRAPVEGTVKFVNPKVLGKAIADPYGEDWGVLLSTDKFDESSSSLFTGDAIKGFLKNEFSKLKDFLSTHPAKPELAGVTMYDGGNVVEGALSLVAEHGLEDFEKEFLTF